ncbi:hypothetical protein [Stieleria varia]|uniref:Uncharacterized protein n=1 Tax=Stieleria varia TaxID=2528005 RepID=A0A5C5ZKN9_9BACT|nr:hypothetical protein [Stieleria varia]TWT86993.1 hypothetical protein Pla52n_70640 [Stieleria varia]
MLTGGLPVTLERNGRTVCYGKKDLQWDDPDKHTKSKFSTDGCRYSMLDKPGVNLSDLARAVAGGMQGPVVIRVDMEMRFQQAVVSKCDPDIGHRVWENFFSFNGTTTLTLNLDGSLAEISL